MSVFLILLFLVILQVGLNVVLTSSKQDENLHQILTSCKQIINTLLYSAYVHVLIYYIVNIRYINLGSSPSEDSLFSSNMSIEILPSSEFSKFHCAVTVNDKIM